MSAMKLFVWNDPYSVKYGGSIIYAIAESEDEARSLALAAPVSEYGYPPNASRVEPMTLGVPDRIVDLPYAEIYEWSE